MKPNHFIKSLLRVTLKVSLWGSLLLLAVALGFLFAPQQMLTVLWYAAIIGCLAAAIYWLGSLIGVGLSLGKCSGSNQVKQK